MCGGGSRGQRAAGGSAGERRLAAPEECVECGGGRWLLRPQHQSGPAMKAHPLLAGGCAQVSRDAPPPLLGGYKIGEKVFYIGETLEKGGFQLVHGGQGEVAGPGYEGKGLSVLFAGSNLAGCLFLNQVRRLRAVPLPPPSAMRPPHAALSTPTERPRPSTTGV